MLSVRLSAHSRETATSPSGHLHLTHVNVVFNLLSSLGLAILRACRFILSNIDESPVAGLPLSATLGQSPLFSLLSAHANQGSSTHPTANLSPSSCPAVLLWTCPREKSFLFVLRDSFSINRQTWHPSLSRYTTGCCAFFGMSSSCLTADDCGPKPSLATPLNQMHPFLSMSRPQH